MLADWQQNRLDFPLQNRSHLCPHLA